MDEWTKERWKAIAWEIFAICAITCFAVIGLYCQFSSNFMLLILSESIDSDFALVILQIQATVDALTIAIIALISGNISDSNMGIAFSDYYLNIRPSIFKQKRIIVSSFLLLVINIGFFIMGWYYLVLWIFVITIILILMSISGVYLIFNGNRLAEKETKDYINYVLSRGNDYRKKYVICMEFIIDWKNVILSQSREDYEAYKEIFLYGLEKLLSYETQESLAGIKEICKKTEYCFLNSENSIVRGNGIELLQEIYGTLWKYILSNKERVNYQELYQEPFDLFDEISRYVVDAVMEMPPEKHQKYIRWDGFIEYIQRITFWIGYDEDKSKIELGNTYYFARYAGNYLSMYHSDKNVMYWEQILERSFWTYTANIPEARIENFLEARCITKFNYIYGFVENGLDTLVINSFFGRAMADILQFDNKYEVLLGLLVHCYLYYLSSRESEKVITSEVKNCAKKVITDRNVKQIFNIFLGHFCMNSHYLNIDLMKQMLKILSPYERFNNYSKGYMIIENVIKEYYMFIILFLSNTYHMPSLLERNLDDDIYIGYVYENKTENTKKLLLELYKLVDDREGSEQEMRAKVDLMFEEFSAFEKRKFKEKQMKKAVENHIQYILYVDIEKVKKHIQHIVKEKLSEKFSEIIVDFDEQGEIMEIPVLRLFDYTDSINENCVDRFCPNMYGQFSLGLEWILLKRNILNKVDRIKDFLDDRDYMDYLQSNRLELLIGSRYVLINKDYRLTHEFEKLTEDWETIYTMLMENGLALKKDSVKVCIHSVEVTIRSQSISDEKQDYNEKTGLYTYSIYSGMPIDFKENELEEFLHNNRKIVDISAKISVQTPEEKIGILITEERRNL